MDLKSFLKMSVLFFICLWTLVGCAVLSDLVDPNPTTQTKVEGAKGVLKICEYDNHKAIEKGECNRFYYVKKDPKTGNYYEAYKAEDGKWYWTEKGGRDRQIDMEDAGSCTHLYLVDDKGREHFLDHTLTAVGANNEKWELRKITAFVNGPVKILLAKEMPDEVTFIDQVRIRVRETDPFGNTKEYYLEGTKALKDGTNNNCTTAFLNDGKYVSISSSKIEDLSSHWGVQKGETLELTFDVPPLQKGHMREYYVMTLGYHIKENSGNMTGALFEKH
jgi:hypothetical protein